MEYAVAISAAVVTITVAIVVTDLGLKLSAAQSSLGDARVDATAKAGQLAIAASDTATQKLRADMAEQRLKDLDALVSNARDIGPVDGAFDRLLQAYADARTNSNATAGVISGTLFAKPAPDETGSTDLLRPNDA